MKTICLLLQMMTTSIVVLAQLPYQHQLFRSQANYPSIVAAMDELLKENPSEEENGLSSNYYRWKYFWDTRVSIKSGVQNSFYPSFAVMKNYWDNKEDYCVSNGSYQGNWKVLGPFDEITTRVNAHENNSGDNIQGNGRVDALWINPEDEDHILAGSISGGLWKTDDGGDSWTCLTDAAGLPAMGIQDVSVDPLNGQHIWMATGSGYIMSSYGYGLGLVYSVDGGDTWQVDEDFLDAVDPDNAQLPIVVKVRFVPGTSTLFACSGNRIFRNLNGTPNAGWEVVLTCPNTELIFDDLEFPPGNNQIILASSTDGNGNGGGAQLWMSQSYGASGTWQEIAGIPNPLANTVTGGDFQDQNLSPYQNSGGGTGNQAWHIVNNGTEYYAAMLPAASTAPNYLYYALPSGRWFTCGADKEFSFVYSLPARSRLTLRVSDDDALDVNNPNPDDLVIWESHPAGTYSSGDVPETSVDAPFSYSCLPPEVFYSKFYFRVELAGDYVNLPGTSVTLDDIVVTSSSAEKIGIDVPDASRCYIMVHYIWDNSKYMYYTENWGITFTLNATLGNTCTTSGISNSCWGELRPDFEVSAGGNHPIFYVGGNTVEKYIWNTGSLMYDAFKISNYGGVESHADIRRLILYNNGTYSDPLSHVLFAGTDGGISKKKLNETTFRNINGNGLAITQYYGFSGIEDEVYEIIGGAQDNGITRIENGAWEHTLFGDGFETAIDFGINAANNEHYVFAESSSGPSPAFNFSSNGGLSFGIGVKPSGWSGAETQVKPMKIIRKNNGASRLYVGGHTDLYYVDDRTGLQSTDFSPFLFKDNFFDPNTDYIPPIISFDLHKEDDEHLYLAYSGNSAGKRLFVVDILSYLSGNGSTGWSDVTGSLPTSSFRITDVVSNPANHEEVWVTFGEIDWPLNSGTNRVFYSDDAGITWHDVSRGLTDFPVNCIVYQEGSDNILYIGTDVGVYVWTHGGGVTNWINPDNKWQCFGTNLPACIVSDLEINYCAGKLRAATWGRGIWESDLYPQTLATPRMQNTATWSSDRKEIQSISIPSGQTLTIVNCTVNMAANTYIKVQPGGNLILDGCTLTNSCGYLWSGIQVLGDPTKKQSPSTNQGVLIMKNGAKIENAYVAAMADEASYSALDYTYPNGKSNGDGVDEHGGGIIQVQFSQTDPVTISNCRKGIGFGPYHSPLVSGVEPANKSYIYGAVFENTGTLNMPYSTGYTTEFISMWQVHGVGVSGNKFYGPTGENQTVSQVKGIVSTDAGYSVSDYCISQNIPCSNTQVTEFHNLYRGVYSVVSDPSAAARLLSISNCTFDNVRRSVYLSGHQNADVIFNTINLNQTSNDTSYGIYTNGCSFYTIEENTINGLPLIRPLSYGIIINSSVSANNVNDDNLVYKNFLNDLQYGTVSMRRNANTTTGPESGFHGLEFRCNEYRNVKYSIAAFPIPNSNQKATLKFAQGSSSDPAGNYFELNSGQYSLYKQQIPDPIYYYHDLPNYDPTDYLYAHFSPSATAITTVSCPSHFSGGGGQQRLEAYSPAEGKLEIQAYLDAADSLLSIIDGGNTAQLISLANDLSVSSSHLKTELLGVGPYISDTVLNTTLARSNPMKNSDTKEVILNNSPVTDTVYSVLEEEKPVVAENAVVINAQDGVSERSNLLAEVGDLYLQAHLALHDLRDYYEENDSVNEFYQYLVDEHRNEYAIPYAFQFNELETAQTMIESMSESDLKAFYQLAYDKQTAGTSIYSLQPDELDWMHSIANEESVSGLMALNLLSIVDGTGYYEDIPVIDEEEFQAERLNEAPYVSSTQWMQPSPNPANTDVTILFAPEFSSDGAELILLDVFGHAIWSVIIADDFPSITIPSDNFLSGIYFVQLKSDDQLLETQKLVVSR